MPNEKLLEIAVNPLAACTYAQHTENGKYTLIFNDERAARTWLVKFSRASTREQTKAEKAFDLEARAYAMSFITTRKRNRVTVHFLPKTCPIIGDEGGPVDE